jgi:Protein of unknown function (DUF2281)
MNSAEIKWHLFREIDNLPPNYLHELQEVVQTFIAKKRPSKNKKRTFGCLKGFVVYMAPDFNVSLEDFNA